MTATPAWLAAAEVVINRGIQASSQATALARRLDGTSLEVVVSGTAPVRVSVVGTRLTLVSASSVPAASTASAASTSSTASASSAVSTSFASPTAPATPGSTSPDSPTAPASPSPPADATIRGPLLGLLRMARGRAPTDRAAQTGVTVQGDAEIANLYRQLLTSARPDLEEELSRVVGDLSARRLSRLASDALSWLRATRRSARENLADYLTEELRALVNRTELDEFLTGVDRVRETADRVAARIARLEQRRIGQA